jgi:rhodanese-related sulfurtransferase
MRSVSPEEALSLVKSGKVLVLDVRTPQENAQGRIKGSLLIPVQELESRISEVPKGKPILVYCRAGHRSLLASRILEKHGFRDVLNLKSGIIDCPAECLE